MYEIKEGGRKREIIGEEIEEERCMNKKGAPNSLMRAFRNFPFSWS